MHYVIIFRSYFYKIIQNETLFIWTLVYYYYLVYFLFLFTYVLFIVLLFGTQSLAWQKTDFFYDLMICLKSFIIWQISTNHRKSWFWRCIMILTKSPVNGKLNDRVVKMYSFCSWTAFMFRLYKSNTNLLTDVQFNCAYGQTISAHRMVDFQYWLFPISACSRCNGMWAYQY